LKYVPSLGATNADETSDIKNRVRIDPTACIVAKVWLSTSPSHTKTATKPNGSTQEVNDR
jgi:hypothetical protein